MGHQLVGTLPDTVPWRRVVEILAEDGDAPAVAAATTQTALKGLELAESDEGLVYSTWLLAQVALAARTDDFAAALHEAGISVSDAPDVFDVVSGYSDAVDHHLLRKQKRTDVGEMAQLAAVESLTSLLGQRSANLFEVTADHVQDAAYELSTQRGFGSLAHDFFTRFARRFLTYHLGRELSNHVGGNGRFAVPEEHDQFVEQLGTHCSEAAAIMRTFAGDWYAKHRFQDGVSQATTRGFVNHSLEKLRDELQIRGRRNGQ